MSRFMGYERWTLHNSYGQFFLFHYFELGDDFELYDAENDISFCGTSSNECLAKMIDYYS